MDCPACHSQDTAFFSKDQAWHCLNEKCSKVFVDGEALPAPSQKIFLSYGHDKNQPLVKRIQAALEARGHQAWIDKEEINHSDDWREAITKGIQESSGVLAFLSAHSVRNPGVCLDEIGIALVHKGGAIVTVLVEPELEVNAPAHVTQRQWLDMSDWQTYWDVIHGEWADEGVWFQGQFKHILAAVERNRRFSGDIQKLQELLLPLPLSSKVKHLLGQPFFGRQWLVNDIEDWRFTHNRERVYWLTAGAGVGKSAFMARFSYIKCAHVAAVHFCDYLQPDSGMPDQVFRTLAFQLATRFPDYRLLLLQQLRHLSKPLSEFSAEELFETLLLQPLQHKIDGGDERYLILIDALDEADTSLSDVLAQMLERLPEQFSVVISSRPDPALLGRLAAFPRKELALEDARNQADLSEYVSQWFERLRCKKIALEQQDRSREALLNAAAGNILYLVHAEEAHKAGSFNLNQIEHYPQGLVQLYGQWFRRMFSDTPDGKLLWHKVYPLLCLVAVSPQPIPVSLARKWLKWTGQEPMSVPNALGSLLLKAGDCYALSHKSIKDWLVDEQGNHDAFWINAEEAQASLLSHLSQYLPTALDAETPDSEYAVWALAQLLPATDFEQSLASFNNLKREDISLFDRLSARLSLVHSLQAGKVKLNFIEWNAAGAEHFLGDESPVTLRVKSSLATTLQGQGNLKGAREIQQQTLAIEQRTLGEEHPSTLATACNLATTLLGQGDLAGARELQQHTLAILQRTLGEEHPSTLTTAGNLASTLRYQGDLAGARELLQHTLAILQRTLGKEHSSTLITADNLALTLAGQGDLEGARELQQHTLAILQRTLGKEHPNTLTSASNLAHTLADQGDLEGARELQQHTLAILQRTLSDDHPSTLTTAGDLARTLRRQGDLAGARELQHHTLTIQQRTLGEEHTSTLITASGLANTLQRQGDLEGARELLQHTYAILQRTLGEEHPSTLTTAGNLAGTLEAQGDLAGARKLLQHTLAIQQRTLGEEHPSTLTTACNLASTLYYQDDLEGARELLQHTLAIQQRTLGDENPSTLATADNLARTLADQGDLAGTRELLQHTLAIYQRTLGEEHPRTLTTACNLASTLANQGDLEGARELQQHTLAIKQRTLGEEHPSTLTTAGNLAVTLADQGNLEGARELQQHTLAILRRTLGEEHPTTLSAARNYQ
jgi:hypothetical protein